MILRNKPNLQSLIFFLADQSLLVVILDTPFSIFRSSSNAERNRGVGNIWESYLSTGQTIMITSLLYVDDFILFRSFRSASAVFAHFGSAISFRCFWF